MSYLGTESDQPQPHPFGWPSQLCALAAAAAIGLVWWLIPVNDELDDIALLTAIALLGFAIVVAGMTLGRYTLPAGEPQSQIGSFLFLRRLVPAVVSRSRRRPRREV